MKVGALIIGLAMAATAILTAGTLISEDPDSEQFVAHPNGALLAVTFAHADHTEQNCIACHHNFVDDTGMGLCFDCHKTDPEVAPLIETQFHDLCRSCHLTEQLSGAAHGPTRACLDCHQRDTAP